MAVYFRTAEMEHGGPFHCFNCGKKLATRVRGSCHIQFLCPRCKAFISIKLKEPINWSKEKDEEEPMVTGKETKVAAGGAV